MKAERKSKEKMSESGQGYFTVLCKQHYLVKVENWILKNLN